MLSKVNQQRKGYELKDKTYTVNSDNLFSNHFKTERKIFITLAKASIQNSTLKVQL